jgi:hypothetical protein
VDSNGWRRKREPNGIFYYEGVEPERLPLAAAEAFMYGAIATLKTDAAGRAAVAPMIEYLSRQDTIGSSPVADIFVVDDGSPVTGEILNLLTRRNLLYASGPAAKPGTKLVVTPGSPEFPKEKAANPSDFAYLVRRKLGDANRSLRIFGSETIVGQLTADGRRARLQLLNYGTDPVESFRIRVLGEWRVVRIHAFRDGAMQPEEETIADGGTEFGIPKLSIYGTVDLVRK